MKTFKGQPKQKRQDREHKKYKRARRQAQRIVTRMKEFDPTSETHHPLLIIKAVEPGCTMELQIENAITGKVVRITTTDDADSDAEAFEDAVLSAFREVSKQYGS